MTPPAKLLPLLPEQVAHPIMGRKFDVSVDELMLAGAVWMRGLPRGDAPRAEATHP